jgi:hypothetical protein
MALVCVGWEWWRVCLKRLYRLLTTRRRISDGNNLKSLLSEPLI